MKSHSIFGKPVDTSRGENRSTVRSPDRYLPTACHKVPAASVPYGSSISLNGKFVWAAFQGDTLISIGATADEARRTYKAVMRRKDLEAWEERERQRAEENGQKS